MTSIKKYLIVNGYDVNKKCINNELMKDEVLFMYKSLLSGEISSFSNGVFSNNNNGYSNFLYILDYVISIVNKWDRDAICLKYSRNTLAEYKLMGISSSVKKSPYELINDLYPEYKIMPWELKKSSCGNGYWVDANIESALIWLKNKLKVDKNIINVVKCGEYGFDNIIDEYGLCGMRVSCFKSSMELFERMYVDKYSRADMLHEKYNFKVDISYNNRANENILYVLNDEYYNLEDRGVTLINEVVKYCDENNRFPNEDDMRNKQGYISSPQFNKYFGKFTEIYKYISPVNSGLKSNRILLIPKEMKCSRCGIEKPFNRNNFQSNKASKFGLSRVCTQCCSETTLIRNYKNKGIAINNITDLTPIEWWEMLSSEKIQILPKHCYDVENMISISRYVIMVKLGMTNRHDISRFITKESMIKYQLYNYVSKLGGKLGYLKATFPEYNYSDEDLIKYTKEYTYGILDRYIKDNDISVSDIINGKAKFRDDTECSSMLAHHYADGTNMNELLVSYFDYNNILHPVLNREITEFDFMIKCKSFFDSNENIINAVKYYCEIVCEDSILDNMNKESLKTWTHKYLTQTKVSNSTIGFCWGVFKGLYDMITCVYPEISSKKLLFEWEWIQCSNSNREFLIKALRDYVLYRMDGIIDLKNDIPRNMNRAYFDINFSKFNKHLSKGRFKNYYEWACLSFPEYSEKWEVEDFDIILATDGTELDSYQEKSIYEFIQGVSEFRMIKSIGRNKIGKYIFDVSEISEDYKKLCPDFVVEKLFIGGKVKVMNKPIIIEYYGMYEDDHKHKIFKNYKSKTLFKENYYNNNSDINYIGVYPKDLKDGFKTLGYKLQDMLSNV